MKVGIALHRLGQTAEVRSLIDAARSRIASDEQLFHEGNRFDSYPHLAISKRILEEAEEMTGSGQPERMKD